MLELLQPFEAGFLRQALLALLLLAANCAGIGTYLVLRRMSLLGSAITHTLLPGVVAAHWLGAGQLWGAAGGAVATALLIGWLTRHPRVREDTATGVLYSGLFALGLLLMTQRGAGVDIHGVLFGQVLAVDGPTLAFMAVNAAVVNGVLLLLHKELVLASYDPTYSAQTGQRPELLRYVLLVLTALTVVAGMQAVGLLLTTAFLVTPAAAASLLSRRFGVVALLACLLAAASGAGGLLLSAHTDWAAGPTIVVLATAVFLAVWLLRGALRRSP